MACSIIAVFQHVRAYMYAVFWIHTNCLKEASEVFLLYCRNRAACMDSSGTSG